MVWSPTVRSNRFVSVQEKVSASTHNQAFNALLFLYREVLNIDL
ncbi:phage integrase N-terminal SAM-like domain-containing protein [Rivularia sp. UHCC 0363]